MHSSILTSWNIAKTAKNPTSLPQSKTTTHHSTTARCSMVGWCFKLRIPTLSLSLRYVPLILHGFQTTKTLHHRNWRTGKKETHGVVEVESSVLHFLFFHLELHLFLAAEVGQLVRLRRDFGGNMETLFRHTSTCGSWIQSRTPNWNESSSNHLSTPHVVPWKQPVIPMAITVFWQFEQGRKNAEQTHLQIKSAKETQFGKSKLLR